MLIIKLHGCVTSSSSIISGWDATHRVPLPGLPAVWGRGAAGRRGRRGGASWGTGGGERQSEPSRATKRTKSANIMNWCLTCKQYRSAFCPQSQSVVNHAHATDVLHIASPATALPFKVQRGWRVEVIVQACLQAPP